MGLLWQSLLYIDVGWRDIGVVHLHNAAPKEDMTAAHPSRSLTYSLSQTIWTRELFSEGLLQNALASGSIRRYLRAFIHEVNTAAHTLPIKGYMAKVIIHRVLCHIIIIQYPPR